MSTSTNRTITILLALFAAGLGLFALFGRGGDSGAPGHRAASPGSGDPGRATRSFPSAERPSLSTASGAARPTTSIDPLFEVPDEHRPGAIREALSGFGDWVDARFPEADVAFHGADCATLPCMIGLDFTADRFADVERTRAFFTGVRAEIERRVGFAMQVVHADEDTEGRQYLWMYGLPDTARIDPTFRRDLRDNAERRHAARLDPIRPKGEPHVPGPGEPGYQPDTERR